MQDTTLQAEQALQHHMSVEQQHYYFKKILTFLIMKLNPCY
ncbi:hypothetical protein AIOL_000010 [Candidatus Rhodobacter oscarellae]|uniref:Uncharacterized protein n=1 Tax=Candidatus Rhodobacter oscarellae TaxID=1675527 RepID=A0A0J9EAP7_9RHOB|nr:hypothetical protein AIOL_000010 [Candidatus Rhodobacter lobularis]